MTPIQKLRRPEDEARRKAALDASWGRRREEVAARIEQGALTLFVERGIDCVTVDDIAAAASISRRTFYRYFESPQDVVRTVLCRSMDLWAEAVRRRPFGEPMLIAFHAANAETVANSENRAVLYMAMQVMRQSPEAWTRIVGPVQAHTAATYRAVIAERMAAVGEDTRPAGAVAAAITAIMIHMAEQSAQEGRVVGPNEVDEAIKALQRLIGAPAALSPTN